MVQFYRTFAKRSGASRGSRKCSIKVTQDVDVPNAQGDGTIRMPLIGQLSFSIPEGTDQSIYEDVARQLSAISAIRTDSPDPADDSLMDAVKRQLKTLEI
jgi:hypothetical protein